MGKGTDAKIKAQEGCLGQRIFAGGLAEAAACEEGTFVRAQRTGGTGVSERERRRDAAGPNEDVGTPRRHAGRHA